MSIELFALPELGIISLNFDTILKSLSLPKSDFLSFDVNYCGVESVTSVIYVNKIWWMDV